MAKMKNDIDAAPGTGNLGSVELERTRLLDAVMPHLAEGGVLTLTSGPGGGKTVFLRQALARTGERTAYLDLAGFSADSSILSRQLEQMFLQLWPDLRKQEPYQDVSAQSSRLTLQERLEALLDTLLISGDTPALIALDGCEVLVDRPLWHDLVALLLYRLPFFVSLALCSRIPLSLPALARIRPQGRLLEIGPDQLYFDKDELVFLLSKGSAQISNEDAARIHEQVGGWPAGIALLSMEMEKRGSGLLDNASTACLHEYMQCAVFSDLPSNARKILCSLALVQPFDDHIITALFAKEQVDEVISTFSYFFTPRAKNIDEHVFVQLYADFFQAQAPVILSRDGVRDLHRRALSFFRRKGANNRALAHLIALQAWREAVELILVTYQHWFDGEDYSQLPYWVEQLPADVIESSPRLGILLGQAHMFLGHLDAAGQAVGRAYAKARPGSKVWLESGCLLCEIMLLQGNKEEEVELANELINRSGLISPFRVRAMMFKAIGLHLMCRFQESDRLWRKITTIARSKFIPLNKPSRAYIMAPKAVFHNLERGEFEESGQILDEAIAVFRVHDPMKRLGWMLLFKGICSLEMHQYGDALVWLREAEVISGRTNRSVHATCIAFLALVLAILDQRKEAGQWLERAEPLAAHDLSLWAPIICSLVRARLAQGTDGAMAELQRAWNLANQRLMLFPLTMTAYLAHGLRDKMATDSLAIQFCRQTADKCKQWNMAHREARLHLYLYMQLRDKDPQQAELSFCRAMTLISENRHGFLVTGDRQLNGLSLVLLAINRNIGTDYFLHLVSFWGWNGQEALADIFTSARLELKIKIIRVWVGNGYRPAMRFIEQTMKETRGRTTRTVLGTLQKRLRNLPPEPLNVRLFGRFVVARDMEKIPDSAWKRQKARDLFKYFCLHPKTIFTREQLAELFWPDMDPEKARDRLWSAISAIRTVLEPELPARARSHYLHCTGQTYSLDIPAGSTIDTMLFAEKIKKGHGNMKTGDTARALLCFEGAVTIYRDDLLPADRYASWCDSPRDHYRRLLIDTLRAMASIYKEKRDFDASIRAGEEIIARDSWDENAYLELMRCYVLQGRELKAVALYQRCEEVLSRELSVAPAPELQAFVQRILNRRQTAACGQGNTLPPQPN